MPLLFPRPHPTHRRLCRQLLNTTRRLCCNVLARPRRMWIAPEVRLLIPNPQVHVQFCCLQPLPLPYDDGPALDERLLWPDHDLSGAVGVLPDHGSCQPSVLPLHTTSHPCERCHVAHHIFVPALPIIRQATFAFLRHQKGLQW